MTTRAPLPARILIPVANPMTAEELIRLGAAMLDPRAGELSALGIVEVPEGMPLYIDATLLYDDPTPGDNMLTESDLQSDSPYNTRKHTGLPPTPIASPRLSSIEAALEPANVKYQYYVLCPKDGKGVHRFSVSNRTFINDKHECLGT